MEKKQIGSYSWFILVWVVLVLLVGWLLVAHVQNAQSASQAQPAIEQSQIQQRGARAAYSGYTTIADDLDSLTR